MPDRESKLRRALYSALQEAYAGALQLDSHYTMSYRLAKIVGDCIEAVDQELLHRDAIQAEKGEEDK